MTSKLYLSLLSLPDDFDKILSVMRSRSVSVSIILQNLAQLKALFEKQWESIVGNCDEMVYLGGNEQSTHKYVSELLGKETIDTNTYGRSDGMRGSFSTNYQMAGRDLMTPDEVRLLDNSYEIVFIRGEKPVLDEKYDIMTHPNIHSSADGGAKPYDHGTLEPSGAGIEMVSLNDYPGKKMEDFPTLDEYVEGLYAFDEDESEAMSNYMEDYEKEEKVRQSNETNTMNE